MTIGDHRDNALAAPGPAVATGHVGRGGSFVDEHQLGRVQTALHRSPGGARRGYVGAVLLGRPDLLFFSVTPSRLSARHTVTSPTEMPHSASSQPRSSVSVASGCAVTRSVRAGRCATIFGGGRPLLRRARRSPLRAGAGRLSPHRTG